jgi:hypothetical protein
LALSSVPPSSSLTLEEGTDIVAKASPWQMKIKSAREIFRSSFALLFALARE